MRAPPAIIDTNVVVSGLLTSEPDAPTARILDRMLQGRFVFLLSVDLLAEYRAVLLRPKIRRRHRLTEAEIDSLLTEITANGRVRDRASEHLDNEDGDEHLRGLLNAEPDSILVTGDQALLKRVPTQRGLSPRAFVEQLERA